MLSPTLLLLASLSVGAAPPTNDPPRPDAFGDPLPPGALARLGTVRLRHGALVSAVAYAPDGSFVAAGGQDRTIRLWEPATGKELATLRGHTGSIQSLAISPDGKTLASGGQGLAGGTILLWDVKDRAAAPRRLIGHTDSVHALLFTPDGKSLISGGWDGTIHVWDVATGKHLRSIGTGKWRIRSLALAPGGKQLASANLTGEIGKFVGSIQLWELSSGKHVREVVGGQKTIYHIAFSPDGNTLASGQDDGPKVWEVASGSQLVRLGQTFTYTPCVAFAPNGRSVLAGGSGFLIEYHLPTGRERRSFEVGALYTYAAAFSPDGKTLATGNTHSVGLWDFATAKQRFADSGHDGQIAALVFAAGGKELLSAGYGRTIFRWDAATGRLIGRMPGPQPFWNSTLVLSPDGKTLAAFGPDFSVVLLDAATGAPRTKFTRHRPANTSGSAQMSVAFAPDGKSLFSSASFIDPHLRRWEAATGNEILAIPTEKKEQTTGLVVSPDGKTLYSASRTGSVRVWDAATGKELRQIGQPMQWPTCLALSPDGRFLVTALSNRACVFDAATGRQLHEFARPGGYAGCIAFSPDGRTLAVAGNPTAPTRFWELASGKLRLELPAPGGAVQATIFSPNGRLFATAGGDTTALVWDFRALPLLREPHDAQPSPKRLGELIAGLSDPDGAVAFRAVCALARAPEQATRAFAPRLLPAEPKRIAELIAQLGDDEFEVREKAMKELTALGTTAETALHKAAAGSPDVDVRLRAGVILRALDGPADGFRLSALRKLEVLEMIGTPAARTLVERIAKGPAEAEQTQEAKRTLGRMGRTGK
jgi:WD40 repeat protein